MTDREKAIVMAHTGICMLEDEELDFVQEHKKLPIILETRGKAHWIEVGREEGALGIQYKRLKCSKCGWESSLPIPRNFCPECGADMRGEQNEHTD